MIATLTKSVKTETKTFPIGTRVKTLAVNFGPESIYRYLCECDGEQFEVESHLLEAIKV